jgi:hypothetical protein
MRRITRKDLTVELETLCQKMGKTVGYLPGNWNLDYNAIYGGYILTEYMEKGGEHHPLLRNRLPAGQMYDCLRMAIDVLSLNKETK